MHLNYAYLYNVNEVDCTSEYSGLLEHGDAARGSEMPHGLKRFGWAGGFLEGILPRESLASSFLGIPCNDWNENFCRLGKGRRYH